MRQTWLILFEGMPGAGKSSLAQWLTDHLTRQGEPVRWWYEEEVGHPVYLFRDAAGIAPVLADLAAGGHQPVIEAAVAQWQRFADAVQQMPERVVLDGCLFGYLTWTLFHYAVPEIEIVAYIDRVATVLRPLQPCLIACSQRDVAGTLARLGARRGQAHLARAIDRVERSPYGRRHSLQGFPGLVTFWSAYQRLIDAAVARCDWPKQAIDTSTGDWTAARRAVLEFLDLAPVPPVPAVTEDLARLCGVYQAQPNAGQPVCRVELVDGTLVIDGLPQTWPRTPLLPRAGGRFALASLPFEVAFITDAGGDVVSLIITGPTLLGGTPAGTYSRVAADSA
jgi:hypothetical protein